MLRGFDTTSCRKCHAVVICIPRMDIEPKIATQSVMGSVFGWIQVCLHSGEIVDHG